ncbi:MAG TPA: carbohydrate ABC transporter permease [Clostridiales bacterium]|nr:carbohydrate ABC transporter permease [Clostridiales bacterium]
MDEVLRKKIQDPIEDKILYTIVYTVLILFTLTVLYPLIYILSASFSSGSAVSTGRVVLWPVEPSLEGYKAVFRHKHIVSGYTNTIFYTFAGTLINVAMTMVAAYPLSRRDMQFKKFYMFLFVFTMYFGGGLIPTYILMTQIKFINTIWVMVIPGALSVYNMIVTRTFIMSNIPQELLEAAQIDGCSDAKYFFIIVLPLSKAIIAVITLFYAVGHWNSYFNALIYLNEPKRYPLQLILRTILVANQVNLSDIDDPELIAAKQGLADLLKYSLIVVSTVPILALYPFVQKFFIKGVMIGSIKG